MPPKVKITKKMVTDASFEVIRASGHENLNARTISEYLGCSTQPVLYSFKTVDEIREAAYEIADQYHTEFIMPKDKEENGRKGGRSRIFRTCRKKPPGWLSRGLGVRTWHSYPFRIPISLFSRIAEWGSPAI